MAPAVFSTTPDAGPPLTVNYPEAGPPVTSNLPDAGPDNLFNLIELKPWLPSKTERTWSAAYYYGS